MSYCLNPDCQKPQNVTDAKFCQSCGEQLLLQNRYRAIKPIGAGGFGRTFLAVDELAPDQKRCVIKQFFPQDQGFINALKAEELFRQEAVRLSILGKHPQIPELVSHFESDSQQYLVQEYIDGKNLAEELADKGAFNEKQIRQLLNDLLPVLQFVHSHQLIHRDIKPENIIRRQADQQLVLVDFGAAKFVDKNAQPRTGTVIGSAAYTAPEQLMGKAVFASDLYSLGVTCVHLLTQMPPFDLFDSREGTWAWRDYAGQVISPQLGGILDKMLQTAINRRYLSAAQAMKALHAVHTPVKMRPLTPVNAAAGRGKATSQAALMPAASPHIRPLQQQRQEIQKALQEALESFGVKVQVNLAKTQLTIVINREEEQPVNYLALNQVLKQTLAALPLKFIDRIKVFGRINKQSVPEWQLLIRTSELVPVIPLSPDEKQSESEALVELIYPPSFDQKSLAKLKNNPIIWQDILLFLSVVTIFNHIIIFSAINSVVLATCFMVVKYSVCKAKSFSNDQLFKGLVTAALIFSILQIRWFITGSIGILMACLFVGLPFFYMNVGSKTN
jgi:serine/threonine protein kinase